MVYIILGFRCCENDRMMISNSALYPCIILVPFDKKKLRYKISDYIDDRRILQQVIISNTVHTVSGGRI